MPSYSYLVLIVIVFSSVALLISSFSSSSSSLSLISTRLTMSATRIDKIKGALIGFYSGDSLAMPVHWFYDLNQLRNTFPDGITKYENAPVKMNGSIMNLSNTGGGGRGSDKGSIIGDVINHGKKQYWIAGGNYHYHQSLKAGENTLDALVTRILVKSLTSTKKLDVGDFREKYIKFMTTPGSHNDTYAGTCHRMFFSNWINGVAPEKCPDNDNHNVDSIDALMTVPASTIAYLDASREDRLEAVRNAIQTTRRTTAVLPYAYIYSDMLTMIINGETVRNAAGAASIELGMDIVNLSKRSDPMVACYIESSFPALLIFAYKYGDDAKRLLLQNANAGGENVARGSLLGALVGGSVGYNNFPVDLRDNLKIKDLAVESEEFARAIYSTV